MVLARAFPTVHPSQRYALVGKVFDSGETLDLLCRVSGGHVRNLLQLLYSCLQKQDPPLSRETLENVIVQAATSLLWRSNPMSGNYCAKYPLPKL